jgi:hypothetical protein
MASDLCGVCGVGNAIGALRGASYQTRNSKAALKTLVPCPHGAIENDQRTKDDDGAKHGPHTRLSQDELVLLVVGSLSNLSYMP